MSVSVDERGPAVTNRTLVLDDVCLSFGGARAIDGLSFSFESGVLGIVGPNGAGKSSILNVLSGFIRPETGSVRYGDRELLNLPAFFRSRISIGRTFQDPVHAEAMTVRENLFSGLPAARVSKERKRMLATMDLERWYARDVGALPYGVRKLLDIGRALMREPELLLCDEPLSGLDETERDRMEETLTGIARGGVSLIVVEHDVARIRRLAQRIIAVETGRKIADGTPDEVLADPAVIAAFTGTDSDDAAGPTTADGAAGPTTGGE